MDAAESAWYSHDSESLSEWEAHGTLFRVDACYVPVKALGKGAYGTVVAVKHKESSRKYAIKKMTPMAATKADGIHALREIRCMRWLGRHPNIMGLKDMRVALAEDELYLVMECMDTDLHRIIQSPQPLGEAHYKHFMYQLLRGLRFAHAYGVIHRDLKPANLLVSKNCDLVISDFGLARQLPSTEGPMTEHVVTRWYRAPELMLSADGHYSMSVDVWSCGCIFAELLGRTPLFAGKDFMETITMQINVLGTRPADELAYIRSDQALQFLATLPPKPTIPWGTLFPDATEKALDLLDCMLQFHPSKRISVDEALAHPYFDSVRSQYMDPEPELPIGPGGLDFTFETDATLDAAAIKRLIFEESISLRAERIMNRAMRAHKFGEGPYGGVAGSPPGASVPAPFPLARSASGASEPEDEAMARGTTADYVTRAGATTVRYASTDAASNPFSSGAYGKPPAAGRATSRAVYGTTNSSTRAPGERGSRPMSMAAAR